MLSPVVARAIKVRVIGLRFSRLSCTITRSDDPGTKKGSLCPVR